MKILLFGGTTEGRVLAEKLSSLGAEVTVSVATQVGEEELAGLTEVQVVTGRLDQPGMEALLSGFDLCVDATHPYAVRATANIRAACEAAGVPLRRLLRGPSQAEGVIRVDSCARAAEFLAGTQGNILLATGSKELSVFGGLERERLFARVLPTYEGIAACEGLGLLHSHILALQGPFSRELNEAMLEQYKICWLVTKDGGQPGGFEEKLAAARHTGAELVLVERPPDEGESLEEILQQIKERLK